MATIPPDLDAVTTALPATVAESDVGHIQHSQAIHRALHAVETSWDVISGVRPDGAASTLSLPDRYTLYDDFTTGWADQYASGTVSLDTTVPGVSRSALKLLAGNAGARVGAAKAVGTRSLSGSNFRFRVRTDDLASIVDSQIVFSNGAGIANYYWFNWHQYVLDFQDGEWSEVVFSRQKCVAVGTPDWGSIDTVVFRFTPASGVTPTVWFDSFGVFDEAAQGYVSIVCDDGWIDAYTEMAPYMARHGYVGNAFVIPQLAGTNPSQRLDEAQILELHERGWEIGGHGEFNLTTLTLDQVEDDLRTTREWLQDRGLRGQGIYAYPNGATNAAVRRLVGKYFPVARTINYLNQPLPYIEPLRINCLSPTNTTTVANIKTYIDDAVDNGTWLILNYHTIQTPATDSIDVTVADFQEVIDYLASSGAAVLPMGEVLRRVYPTTTGGGGGTEVDEAEKVRTHSILFEDFHSLLTGTFFTATQTGGSSTVNLPPAGRLGAVQTQTGTTATGWGQVNTPNNTYDIGVNPMRLVMAMQAGGISDATNEFIIRFGFVDGTSGAAPVDGAWFEYDRVNGGDFWRVCTSAGSTATKTTTAAAVDMEYHRFEVRIAGGTVTFFIDDTQVGTSSTNLPSGSGQTVGIGWGITKTAGTGARSVRCDYILLDATMNR